MAMKNITKDFIIQKTFEIISQEGFLSITVRQIAREAGVNVSAINYHFGSKDALLQEAILVFLEKTREVFSVLDDQNLEPKERLHVLLSHFAEHIVHYPGFLKTIVGTILRGGEPPAVAVMTITGLKQKLFDLLKTWWDKPDDEINSALVQMFSAILFPTIMGEKVKDLYNVPYSDPAFRRQYIEQLLDRFGVGRHDY